MGMTSTCPILRLAGSVIPLAFIRASADMLNFSAMEAG
jgi:hypothetical protein